MKNQWMFFKTIVFLLVIPVILSSCSSPSDNSIAEPDTAIDEQKPTMHSVEITQMKFYPVELRVKKGDKVVFVNHDLVTHDITEESKRAWSSSPLITDQSWMLVVTENVNYFCSIHPVMKGRIIVE